MNRRQLFRSIAAAFGGIGAALGVRKRQRHIILNYLQMSRFEREFASGRCLVDGIEIPLVWYVDTRRGFVKTYDVDDTHKPVFTTNVGLGYTSTQSRTVHGKVELLRKDGSRL